MVIDKVDKPEPVRYRIESTVETHGQKSHDEKQQEDEYSESAGVKNWQKFHTEAKDRKALKLRRQDISRIFFNQVLLQRGLVIIDVNIQLINRHLLKNACLFSTKIDTYWKLKKLSAGQEIIVDQLIRAPYVEISVRRLDSEPESGEHSSKTQASEFIKRTSKPQKTWALWPLIDEETKKLNLIAISIYLTIIIALAIAMTMLL